jgi:hypothetical protein
VRKYDAFMKRTERSVKTSAKGEQPTRSRATGRAKRDDPDYKQALAYVRRDTHKQVMAALAAQEREFSDLVEELLSKWLKSNS